MKKNLFCIALLLSFCANAQPSSKEIIAKNWRFAVPVNIKECTILGDTSACSGSSQIAQNKFMFRVVNILDDGNLVIQFLKWNSKGRYAADDSNRNNKFYYANNNWNSEGKQAQDTFRYFLLSHKKFDENCEEVLPEISFAVGVLTLPVKARFGNKKTGDDKIYSSFSGNLSLGMSIGPKFRFRRNDKIALNLLAGFSLTSVPVTGETTKEFIKNETNIAALTWHAGVLFEIDNFHVGIFTGIDYLSGEVNSHWDYKNKPWIGAGIGLSLFSNKSATETQSVGGNQ